MLDNCITLTDTSCGHWLENCDQQLGSFRIIKRTMRGGRQEGVDVLDVQCGDFFVRIVPTRGMSIQEAGIGASPSKAKAGMQTMGWNSPVPGPVHPCFVPVAEPSGLGWLDGFNELFVRCGLSSNGAPEFDECGRLVHPLHGRIGNLPASQVEVHYDSQNDQLAVKGTVIESRFHFAKWKLEVEYRFDVNATAIQVLDRVTNIGGTTNAFQMLYHYNLGHELLEPGGKIKVPAKQVVPRNEHSASQIENWQEIESPQAGYAETVYFLEPKSDESGRSLAVLINANRSLAAGIRFETDALPCFSVWKNFAAREDGYVVGLEPATNYPNSHGFEEQHGRVVTLEPGESKSFPLELIFADSTDKVQTLLDESNALQADEPAVLNPNPMSDFCE